MQLCVVAALLLGGCLADAVRRPLPHSDEQRLARKPLATPDGTTEAFFKRQAELAEELFEKTGDLQAAVHQLRSAFVLCPACRYDNFAGAKFRETFSIDMLPDRLFMTEAILPAVARLHPRGPHAPLQMLWAGSHPYTLRYEYLVPGMQITSMDPNPDVAVYGSSHRHAVDVLQNVAHLAPAAAFDIAIVNGVLGWGINTHEELAAFLQAVHRALKPDGWLVVGYNRHMMTCCAFEPYFAPAQLGQLPQKKDFEGQWQHTYETYQRQDVAHAQHGSHAHN